MNSNPPKKLKHVLIEWLDACTDDDIKFEKDKEIEVKKYLASCHTTGWLIKEDKYGYLLTTNVTHYNDGTSDYDTFAIPKEWVQKVTEIKNVKRKVRSR